MEAKIDGSQKVVVPNAGHAVNIDNPERFDAEMGAFLERMAS